MIADRTVVLSAELWAGPLVGLAWLFAAHVLHTFCIHTINFLHCNRDFQCVGMPRLFWLLVAFRVINAVLVQTFFDPDEYWQSLEVAHVAVFNYGHLTWEWEAALRSFLHPALFACLFKLLQLVRADNPLCLVVLPKIMQGCFAAVGDWCMFKYSQREFGHKAARWALLLSISSWFMFYVIGRTYSNSLETVLFQAFLFYWPSSAGSLVTNRRYALALAAICVMIRPTSAVLWTWYGMQHLLLTKDRLAFCAETALIGGTTLFLTAGLDRWFYGAWVLPPLEFLKFNVLIGGASLYGTHPWYWYGVVALPIILASNMAPFLLVSATPFIRTLSNIHRAFTLLILPTWFFIGVLSFNAHKEFRFLLPIVPLATTACGVIMYEFENWSNSKNRRLWFKWAVVLLLLPQFFMAAYFSAVHQRGTVDVVHFVRESAPLNTSVIFLMPCHSTPYHAYTHRKDLSLRFLDCSPRPLDKEYIDEADRFFNDPLPFLNGTSINSASDGPMWLVMFDALYPRIKTFLTERGFLQGPRFFHTHFPSGRVGKEVLLFAHR